MEGIIQTSTKIYVLTKVAGVSTITFETNAEVPYFSRMYITAYSNLILTDVQGTGLMRIVLNCNGTDIDAYCGPVDNSAYGAPYTPYKPTSITRVPNTMRITLYTWNDLHDEDDTTGLLALKIVYEQA